MSKFIYISGEGDFSAMDAEDAFDIKDIYKEMLDNNVTQITKTITYKEDNLLEEEGYESEDDEYTEEVTFDLIEFGEVDPKFEEFVKDNLCDYDSLKAVDIIRVED